MFDNHTFVEKIAFKSLIIRPEKCKKMYLDTSHFYPIFALVTIKYVFISSKEINPLSMKKSHLKVHKHMINLGGGVISAVTVEAGGLPKCVEITTQGKTLISENEETCTLNDSSNRFCSAPAAQRLQNTKPKRMVILHPTRYDPLDFNRIQPSQNIPKLSYKIAA